jgi:hypothetical protein
MREDHLWTYPLPATYRASISGLARGSGAADGVRDNAAEPAVEGTFARAATSSLWATMKPVIAAHFAAIRARSQRERRA